MTAGQDAASLTRGGLLARNVVWNLAGVVLPALVALLAVPLLTQALGAARFGLLSLAWVFVGYFTIFDFGLGRALTQLVSARIAEQRQDSLPGLLGTAAIFALAVSLASGLAVWLLAAPLVQQVMKMPPELQPEAASVMRVLAVSIPFVILGTVARGVLEALQRFDLINVVRVLSGVYLFLGPLLLLPFTHDMGWIIAALAAGKVLATLAFLQSCWQQLPQVRSRLHWQRRELRALFVFGGWITLGNILGPLLSYTDHFVIGATVALSLLGYYSVPYQMTTRLWPVIAAVVGVLFPALSIHLLTDRARAARLFLLAMKSVVFMIAPVCLLLAAFATEFMQLWLGGDYGRIGGPLLRLFALGVFINSFNFVTLALVQAGGRPDWVPKLSMLELPLYLPALFWAIHVAGLQGAALVWLARILIEFVFLLWASGRLLPESAAALRRSVPGLALLIASFLPFFAPLPLPPRLLLAGVWLLAWFLICWTRLLGTAEREALQNLRARLRRAPATGS